jgi:hypothetical protein
LRPILFSSLYSCALPSFLFLPLMPPHPPTSSTTSRPLRSTANIDLPPRRSTSSAASTTTARTSRR